MNVIPPWVRSRLLACGLPFLLLTACGESAEVLPTAVAEAKLRANLAGTPMTWSFQDELSMEEYSRNVVLRQRLETMQKKGLLDVLDEGRVLRVRLTPRGEAYRLSPDPAKPEVKGEVLVRTGVRVLDRVDAVGELQTNQGAKVRDATFTWHYSEVTPFGEALGLKPDRPQQSKWAAVLFGDDWRFVEQ